MTAPAAPMLPVLFAVKLIVPLETRILFVAVELRLVILPATPAAPDVMLIELDLSLIHI